MTTPNQADIQTAELNEIHANVPKNERQAWDRKMNNIVKWLAELRPIEEEIEDLMAKKVPIFDKIQNLREEMVAECIHPLNHLIHMGDHVKCKFCETRISRPQPKGDISGR